VEGTRRAIIAAFLANLGIAVAKFAAFLATGAASMLAEAVHSLADATNQGLLILGGALALRPPTPEHPFGYGRERYFWAFIVAMVLFSMGSVFAISEGVAKLRDPHELASTGWAIAVLLLGIVLESWSLRTAMHEARKVRGSLSWWSYVRRSKQPELPVVLLEDFGALLGLMIALLGVGLASWLGDPRFDALGSIGIGLLLGVIAVILAVEMKSLLIGESASVAHRLAIRDAIEEAPDVRRLIHLRTQHIGPDELLVAAKLEFDARLDLAALAVAIDRVEAAIRERVPLARVIYLEPDVHRQPTADAETTP
jgi:cation diffusion facilitator family transporter